MRAMVLPAPRARLQMEERPDPIPAEGQLRVRINACGVCRTDLHLVDAELPDIRYPIVPGHEIVGRVDLLGRGVRAAAAFRSAAIIAFVGLAGLAGEGLRARALPREEETGEGGDVDAHVEGEV